MHYASEPVTLDRYREYVQGRPETFRKPRGFWVSVTGEDDWPSWCRNEDFEIGRLAVEHTVTLAPSAKILRLHSAAGMREFHDRFAVEGDFERRHPALAGHDRWPIDWRAVAEEYDGVIIAPYQWSQRLGLSWYYGWDVASGCIWNLTAIASVAPVMAVVS